MYKAHQKEDNYITNRNTIKNNVQGTSKGRELHNQCE